MAVINSRRSKKKQMARLKRIGKPEPSDLRYTERPVCWDFDGNVDGALGISRRQWRCERTIAVDDGASDALIGIEIAIFAIETPAVLHGSIAEGLGLNRAIGHEVQDFAPLRRSLASCSVGGRIALRLCSA